jgi:hypothetical protein
MYIRAPTELRVEEGTVLKVIRPLYGVPEAGTHWFRTYHTHHTEKLGLVSSTFDLCLLFNDQAIIRLQTDDTLIAATPEFMVLEEAKRAIANFPAKPIEQLTVDHPLDFNGFSITRESDSILISQARNIAKIQTLAPDFTKQDYVEQRARGAYIATVSQPEAAFALSFAAQTTEPDRNHAKFLNKCLEWQLKGKPLRFVKLDLNSLRLVAFTDSSFANNDDFTSQLGYVIALADQYNNANIIHWQSIKSRRVTRSVLASELYALSLGFDTAATLKATTQQIAARDIPLTLCVDSLSLYECLVKLGSTQEKRLMIDLMSIRQSYERREITEILWIQGDKNPADAMTKEKGKACNALERLVDSNKLELEVEGWVERTE